jgi:hypothetical protein
MLTPEENTGINKSISPNPEFIALMQKYCDQIDAKEKECLQGLIKSSRNLHRNDPTIEDRKDFDSSHEKDDKSPHSEDMCVPETNKDSTKYFMTQMTQEEFSQKRKESSINDYEFNTIRNDSDIVRPRKYISKEEAKKIWPNLPPEIPQHAIELIEFYEEKLRDQKPMWINLAHEKPPLGQYILVSDGHHVGEAIFCPNDMFDILKLFYVQPWKEVTHWMPLPESPEE